MMLRLLLMLMLLLIAATADAKTMYVRPLATCPNNGDGTAYACAASGGAAGAYSNLGGVAWGAGANQVSSGDTLYVCGFHAEGNDGTRTDHSLTPTTNAIIDGDCPDDPGSILSANHVYTSGWTGPDAYGAYYINSGGCSNMHFAQLVAGVPTRLPYRKVGAPDATWENGSFSDDCAGNKYVKPIGGVSANETTLYSTWIGTITLTNVSATVRNLTIYGLSSDYCILLSNADSATVQDNTVEWCALYAIQLAAASDRATVTGNTITESGNGIYVTGVTTGTSSNELRLTSNTIHDLNQTGYYADGVAAVDGHAIGVQGGVGNVITGNVMTHIGGSCITHWDNVGQVLQSTLIASNWCEDVHDLAALGRYEVGIEYSNFNAGHVANDVVNNVVTGNVVKNTGAACLDTKSVLPTVGRPWYYTNNTLVDCAIGLNFRDDTDGNTGFVFKNNICLRCTVNVTHGQNGTDTLTGIVMDTNVYTTDGAASFEWNGTASAFAAWKTNSSQDAASVQGDAYLAGTHDYRSLATSPYRRSGELTGVCADVRGRPCWLPPDIGAYQSSSGDPAATRAARQ